MWCYPSTRTRTVAKAVANATQETPKAHNPNPRKNKNNLGISCVSPLQISASLCLFLLAGQVRLSFDVLVARRMLVLRQALFVVTLGIQEPVLLVLADDDLDDLGA